MLCIRSIVPYINIYSRIVIQLNMYVKIITSSGLSNYHIFGFCARPASGSVSLWPMLEIIRKYTYLPEVVVSSAGSSTTRAARHKWEKKKKNRSRIYDLGVVPTRGNNKLFILSLGPVYEFVCVSFTTGNLNCFRVK
jgi:hypothetical protein